MWGRLGSRVAGLAGAEGTRYPSHLGVVDDEDVGGALVDEGGGELASLGADDERAERGALAAIGGGASVERGGGERGRAIALEGHGALRAPGDHLVAKRRLLGVVRLLIHPAGGGGGGGDERDGTTGDARGRERARDGRGRRDDATRRYTTDDGNRADGVGHAGEDSGGHGRSRVGAGRHPIRRTRRGRVRGRARVYESRGRAGERDARCHPQRQC